MNAHRIQLSLVALIVISGLSLTAQQPRSLQPEDYRRWESLFAQRTPLSPDGSWLVYGINRSNRQNELRFQPTAGGDAIVVAFGEQPAFSDDSRWAACLVGLSEEDEAKLQKEKKPVRKKLAIIDLTAGTTTTIDAIESFSFNSTGTHIAFQRYAEGERTMRIDSEVLLGPTDLVIYAKSMKNWEPPHETERVTVERRGDIIENIRRAFESQGRRIEVDNS